MKKNILTLMFAFCVCASLAQVPVLTGIKAGATISKVSNSSNSVKFDGYVGGFLEVQFLKGYHLQPELVYSRQGFRPALDGANADNVDLNYLSVMLANKFYVVPAGQFYVVVGPAFDFKVGKMQQSIFNDEVAKFDFALFGGLGVEFPFGLGIEARFKHGLVDIFGRDKNSSVANKDLIANQVFQLGFTYHFNAN